MKKRMLAMLLAMAVTCPNALTAQAVESAAADLPENQQTAAQTKLTAGTYTLPLTMKKADNIAADSVAASCIQGAVLQVQEDGTAKVTVNLAAVTMGQITAFAKDWKIYQSEDTAGESKAAEVTGTDDAGHTTQITFSLPDCSRDGVYVGLTIDMGAGVPQNAYFAMDFAHAVPVKTETTETTCTGLAQIAQFGKYDVEATVTVREEKIADLTIEGKNFQGAYVQTNQQKLQTAAEGMRGQYLGKSAADLDGLYQVDAVSGATYSSYGIRSAVIQALGLTEPTEQITVPAEKLAAGSYTVDIRYETDGVAHSLIKEEKCQAQLTADEEGKAVLSADLSNGTAKEPLYIRSFNGYYTDNDVTKSLKTDAQATMADTEYTDDYFPADAQVVSHLQLPLEGQAPQKAYTDVYHTNVTVYVPTMNGLDGQVGDLTFSHGTFPVDASLTVYWDSLKKAESAPEKPSSKPSRPSGTENESVSMGKGTYSVPVSMRNASDEQKESLGNAALNGNATVTYDGSTCTYVIPFQGVRMQNLYGHLVQLWDYAAEDTQRKNPQPAQVMDTYSDTDLNGGQQSFPRRMVIEREGKPEARFYIRIQVDAIPMTPDALLTFDWDKAEKTTKPQPDSAGGSTAENPQEPAKPTESPTVSISFQDVPESHWAAKDIAAAVEQGLFQGTGKTTFDPNGAVTRGMLMTILARMHQQDTQGGTTWYEKGVDWAKKAGISDGLSPNAKITREQLAAMLYRSAQSPAVTTDRLSFADASQVSSWAKQAACWAAEQGILTGKSGSRLDPQGEATRAEAAAILMRYEKIVNP